MSLFDPTPRVSAFASAHSCGRPQVPEHDVDIDLALPRLSPGALRPRAGALLAGAMFVLMSCATPSGNMEEVEAIEERGPSGGQGGTPSLGSVPGGEPQRLSPTQLRERLTQGLVADRDNARYTDEELRQTGVIPPPERTPGAAVAAAAEPPVPQAAPRTPVSAEPVPVPAAPPVPAQVAAPGTPPSQPTPTAAPPQIAEAVPPPAVPVPAGPAPTTAPPPAQVPAVATPPAQPAPTSAPLITLDAPPPAATSQQPATPAQAPTTPPPTVVVGSPTPPPTTVAEPTPAVPPAVAIAEPVPAEPSPAQPPTVTVGGPPIAEPVQVATAEIPPPEDAPIEEPRTQSWVSLFAPDPRGRTPAEIAADEARKRGEPVPGDTEGAAVAVAALPDEPEAPLRAPTVIGDAAPPPAVVVDQGQAPPPPQIAAIGAAPDAPEVAEPAVPAAVPPTPPAEPAPIVEPSYAPGAGPIVISSSGVTQGGRPVGELRAGAQLALAPQAPVAAAPTGELQQIGSILFAHGSARITRRDRQLIAKVVDWVGRNGGVVKIVGHASSRTREMDQQRHQLVNFEMSLKRAVAVGDELVRQGLNPDQVITEARSNTEPLFYEWMPSGEAGNRRADIFILR